MDGTNDRYFKNVKKLSGTTALGLDNSPKVLQILVDISLRSPVMKRIHLLRSESQ